MSKPTEAQVRVLKAAGFVEPKQWWNSALWLTTPGRSVDACVRRGWLEEKAPTWNPRLCIYEWKLRLTAAGRRVLAEATDGEIT